MGSIAVTAGSVRVKTCSEVGTILKDLGRLAEGMDERQVAVPERMNVALHPLLQESTVSGRSSGMRRENMP